MSVADGLEGKIAVYEYDKILQSYQQIWSDYNPDFTSRSSGGIGDLDGDGVNEFVVMGRIRISSTGSSELEIWKNDGIDSWYRSEVLTNPGMLWFSAIADIDGDSFNELVLTNEATGSLEAYQNVGGDDYALDAVVFDCQEVGFTDMSYIKTVADLNDNGLPEAIVQCDTLSSGDLGTSNIYIVEFDTASRKYNTIGTVTAPPSGGPAPRMLIDQMVTGDVNRDGIDDVVLCGNSGRVHVLTYKDGEYSIAFNGPAPVSFDFSQTCGVGDLTNDGYPDFYTVVVSTQIYSYDGAKYSQVWRSPGDMGTIGIGSADAGDADNDGYTELIHPAGLQDPIYIWESDVPNATTFTSGKSLTIGIGPVRIGKIR